MLGLLVLLYWGVDEMSKVRALLSRSHSAERTDGQPLAGRAAPTLHAVFCRREKSSSIVGALVAAATCASVATPVPPRRARAVSPNRLVFGRAHCAHRQAMARAPATRAAHAHDRIWRTSARKCFDSSCLCRARWRRGWFVTHWRETAKTATITRGRAPEQ